MTADGVQQCGTKERNPMNTSAIRTVNTPHGPLTLVASDHGLTRATFRTVRRTAPPSTPAAHAWLNLAHRELDAYLAGELRHFTVPVDLSRVDDAHRRILDALAELPYGQTTTYGALATRLGLVEDGPRQVGAAMARNPVLIIVPCHRVLGAGNRLTGYAGGIAVKQALLDLESRDRPGQLKMAI
jgi:methylated-DNA-[protein]-cysteine S-methyltransferase